MEKKIKIILILVVVFGVITCLGTYLYLDNLRRGQEKKIEESKAPVVFLRADIEADTCITADMLEVRKVDQMSVPMDKVVTKKEDAIGKYVRNRLYGDMVLVKAELMDAEAYKTQVGSMIENGMRAISVPVEMDSGLAGLLCPGCRVDVVFTYNEDPLRQASLLLENKRVVALDSVNSMEKMLYEVTPGMEEESTYQTVTLEVAPTETVKLALALQAGEIRLVLRPQQDDSIHGSRTYLSEMVGAS